MGKPEMGSQEPEEQNPQQEELVLEELGEPRDNRLETRMDVMKKEVEDAYQKRLEQLQAYEEQVRKEFNLSEEDFKNQLKAGESENKDLDVVLQEIYKKREEIEKDKEDAIAGLRQRLKEEISDL